MLNCPRSCRSRKRRQSHDVEARRVPAPLPRSRLSRLPLAAHAPLVAAVSKSDPTHHAPLPYTVVLRGAISQDDMPQRWEKQVVAYSAYEAILQAMFEIGGTMHLDEAVRAKFTVESITPDVAEYWRMTTLQLLDQLKDK